MALLTPNNLKSIITLSIFSRILVFIVQLVSNTFIPDHKADAYRNKYYIALNNIQASNYSITFQNWYSYRSFEGLTKWDSQYFLEISNDGYISEQHLAFLPLYPMVLSFVRKSLYERRSLNFEEIFPIHQFSLEDEEVGQLGLERYIRTAIIGVFLNNLIFFPFAALSLFILTKLVKRDDEKYAKEVIWWFCFNPASIFFSACYTESLFAALTFGSLMIIEYRSRFYLMNHDDIIETKRKCNEIQYRPLTQLNRLLYIVLPSLALLAISTATRSNGLLNIIFIGYQFLLKYAPLTTKKRIRWSILTYTTLLLEIIQDILVMIMAGVIAMSGYITFQVYSYIAFCLEKPEKGKLNIRPEWCDAWLPHPYRQIQAKYWNVGLFQYYQAKQLPNFLLAAPMISLMLLGSLKQTQDIVKHPNRQKQLVYYIQGIILTIFCGLCINVQVTTRMLASSSPVLYWICADVAKLSRSYNTRLKMYFILYFVIGSVLHSNFYPWT